MRRGLALAAVLAGVVLSSTACMDKQTEQFKDAGRDGSNTSPAETITMPDGFNNAATKCDHGNRVYVTFHGDSAYGSIAVVPNDPSCAGAPN